MVIIKSKCKICRRIGQKLFLKGEKCISTNCPLLKRKYPPGIHGPKGYPRLTEYGRQLKEKQKLKAIYSITERKLKNLFKKAEKTKGDTGVNLLKILEKRLDNLIYKSGLADSILQARQLISHKHFLLNDRPINIPSYIVKVGDIIKIKEKSLKKSFFKEMLSKEKKDIPKWIEINQKTGEIKIIEEPNVDELLKTIDIPLVIEFYSR